ncbi:MAG: FHA domain-containing protein [Microcoleus sp. SIO2G3]|nr:FHA domain-containing protein [Microcoleus sp. SIO2G3]
MITLTLLHPLQSVPVQSWPFETESLIRIGRSTDNEVILYSAVVSRHHVELRRKGSEWEIVSLGANGTYIEGKRITQIPVVDGMIIRLASSGPKIQIRLEGEAPKAKLKTALGKRGSRPKDVDSSKDTLVDAQSSQTEDTN